MSTKCICDIAAHFPGGAFGPEVTCPVHDKPDRVLAVGRIAVLALILALIIGAIFP